MDDIELKNIQLQFPSSRRLSGDGACAEIRVRTDRGDIMVAVHGDRNKPAIVTYHDLGLNCEFFSLHYLLRSEISSGAYSLNGDRNKPAIVTYHDLGLNYVSSFQAFFSFVDMRALLENFCVYHVNAPGQEEGAPSLPDDEAQEKGKSWPELNLLAHDREAWKRLVSAPDSSEE
ncbi:unnamed protein product [Plutella xylostella]|uniref:(diamondback moth) hypothetical protein n=1 Tax=Plutella xylostella TaxID=51655 RepID=A0A8S4GAU6_PLUXY|nr:unnamed protein product [Plutella xylostella]